MALVALILWPKLSAIWAQDATSSVFGGVRRLSPIHPTSDVKIPISSTTESNAPTAIINVPVRSMAVDAFDASQAAQLETGSLRDAVLYVASADEPERILRLDKNSLVPAAGSGASGSLGDGGLATAAQLSISLDSLAQRSSIAVAADGTLFISDTLNNTIRRVAGPASSEPGVIRSVAGKWAPAQNVTLQEPFGIAVDRAGNLYVADRAANAVFELHDATAQTPGPLENIADVIAPTDVAVTSDGSKLFASSPKTGSIFLITLPVKSVTPVFNRTQSKSNTANLNLTDSNLCSALSVTPDQKHSVCPTGLAINQSGDLFVSNAAENNILRFNASTKSVRVIASNFAVPGALALDAKGNLYAADQLRSRVVRIADQGGAAACTNTSVSGNLTLCPDSYDFGLQPTGGQTVSYAFTATNNSSSDLTLFTYAITGTNASDFSVQSSSCLATFSANSSCVVNVIFTPSATGERAGGLTLSDANPGDSIASSTAGTGDDYQLLLGSNQLQSVTVTAGYTAQYNLVIQPSQGFSGPVTIVCPANLPSFSYCSISSPDLDKAIPNAVDVTAGLDAPFTVTINTTNDQGVTGLSGAGPAPKAFLPASGNSGESRPPGGGSGPAPFLFLLMLLAILFTAAYYRKRMTYGQAIIGSVRPAVVAIAFCCAIVTGCHHGTAKSSGTPRGTTNLLIQATAQNASRGYTIQLVVQ